MQLRTPEQTQFWSSFCKETGTSGEPYDVFPFGDDPAMADELLALVLAGTKRATATRLAVYERENLPPPKAGDLSLILDGRDLPACIIHTTRVDLVPFEQVDEEFARTEGEGDRSLAYWRKVHLAYYERECARGGSVFKPDELIVCERFTCVWPEQES